MIASVFGREGTRITKRSPPTQHLTMILNPSLRLDKNTSKTHGGGVKVVTRGRTRHLRKTERLMSPPDDVHDPDGPYYLVYPIWISYDYMEYPMGYVGCHGVSH